MAEKKCETECREELICKINKGDKELNDKITLLDEYKVSRAPMWKFVMALIAITAIISAGIVTLSGNAENRRELEYQKGIEKRDRAISENTKAIIEGKIQIATIFTKLDNIEKINNEILRVVNRTAKDK